MPTNTISFVGSTQKNVPAAPSHRNVPLPTVMPACARIVEHRDVVAEAEPRPHALQPDAELAVVVQTASGRWLARISSTVRGARMRTPFSAPPFASICAKRR